MEKQLMSIVIPTTKRTDMYLDWCLEAVRVHTDNKETPCEIIVQREGESYADKNCQGAKKAVGGMLCFMSDDILVMPDWMNRFWNIWEFLQSHSPGLMGVYLPPVGIAQDYGNYVGNNVRDVPAVVTALSFCTREAYDKAGGWDRYFMPGNYSDMDFSIRMKKAGFKNYILPMIAFHFVSRSFESRKSWQEDMDRGRAEMKRKYGEDWEKLLK